MDLSRLETWTREDLEREARRVGIRTPQRLSRRELVERLRAHHSAPVRRASRFLRKMVGVARDLAAGSPRLRLGVPATTPRPNPAAPAPPRPSASPSPKEPTTAPTEPTEPPRPQHEATSPSGAASSAPQAPPDERPQTAPATSAAPAATTDLVEEPDAPTREEASGCRSEDAQEAASPEPAPQAAAAQPSTTASEPDPELDALLAKEPIQTRTMARILAAQGHSRRALAIYRKLLGQRPDDTELRAEAEAARSGKKSRADDDEEEGERDECVSVLTEGSRAVVAWYVREGAIATARRLCGEEAELVLRTIVLRPGDDAVQRTVSERPVQREGQLAVPVPAGTRLIAAVGLRAGDRFVSIAHAPTVAT